MRQLSRPCHQQDLGRARYSIDIKSDSVPRFGTGMNVSSCGSKAKSVSMKGQDHKEIHPKVSFLWCHMVHSAQCLQNESLKSYLAFKHHAKNTGWTAKVQLVVSLSRVAFCLHLVAFLLVSHVCMSYSHWNVLSHPSYWGTAWKKRVMS